MTGMSLAIGMVACGALAGVARADVDPALAGLEKALPAGWTMMSTESELVIRHDRPCYSNGEHLPNEPADSKPTAAPAGGPLITLELRYHLEPKWTAIQLAEARATNDKVNAEANALRARFNIDFMHQGKGEPMPTNAGERTRLAAYNKAKAQLMARRVRLPLCSFGNTSLFDGDSTYSQLNLEVDPPEAMHEAYRVVDLVKKRCGAI